MTNKDNKDITVKSQVVHLGQHGSHGVQVEQVDLGQLGGHGARVEQVEQMEFGQIGDHGALAASPVKEEAQGPGRGSVVWDFYPQLSPWRMWSMKELPEW